MASTRNDVRIEFTHRGRRYSIAPGDLTAVEARDYRREMGQSLAATMRTGDYDIDVVATLIWIVDRREQPGLSWEQVAETLTYDAVEAAFSDNDGDDSGVAEDPSD